VKQTTDLVYASCSQDLAEKETAAPNCRETDKLIYRNIVLLFVLINKDRKSNLNFLAMWPAL